MESEIEYHYLFPYIGVLQSHTALKEHTTSLEAALARREASVAGLSTHVQGELQKRDKMIHELKEQIKEQEAALSKEKQNVKDAKKQVIFVFLFLQTISFPY